MPITPSPALGKTKTVTTGSRLPLTDYTNNSPKFLVVNIQLVATAAVKAATVTVNGVVEHNWTPPSGTAYMDMTVLVPPAGVWRFDHNGTNPNYCCETV